MFLTAGTPHFHMATSSTKNASEPQMISFFSGMSGDGASWQSSTVPPSAKSLAHSSSALLAYFTSVLPVSCATAGPATTPSATTMPSAAINARMRLRTIPPVT